MGTTKGLLYKESLGAQGPHLQNGANNDAKH